MRRFEVEVAEISTSPGLLQFWCRGAAPRFQPGQAALALASQPAQPFLRIPVYPFHQKPEGFEFCVEYVVGARTNGSPHPFEALKPGEVLKIVGPCGHGFELAGRPGHLLLVANSPARLFSLIYEAVELRWNVTFLAQTGGRLWPALPEQVELHRGNLTLELAAWADLIVLDEPEPGALAEAVWRLVPDRRKGYIQALLDVPMPCGTGACQACGVESASGRRLACVDGPVVFF